MRCRRKLNLLGRQGASLFSSGFRRLFAKLLLRNWGEGGVFEPGGETSSRFLSRPPFSFPRKEPKYIFPPACDFLPGELYFFPRKFPREFPE